jgi:formylglycine-generating enzyme required for sulfatase activity
MRPEPDRSTQVVRRILLLMAGLLAVYVAGRAIYLEEVKSRLYAAGQVAAMSGQWPEAFVQFYALVRLDPGYRDARNQLEQVIQKAVRVIPGGNDVDAEVKLLRWLAAAGVETTLAEALDRSVVSIPAGEFLMGSDIGRDDERPPRLVYVDAFELDRYEITNAQYRRFLQITRREPPPYWSGNEYPPGQDDYPVAGVSWPDAEAYCAWAGQRLPTEAEWEKACRGSDGRLYPWGNDWTWQRANLDASYAARPVEQVEPGYSQWDTAWTLLRIGSGVSRLQPVGSYPEGASPYGIMDLAGNVSEWVADWYNWGGYWDWPARNPQGTQPPWNRSLRGSAWYDPNGSATWAQSQSRCSARNSSHERRDPRMGFRCVRSVP